MKNIKIKQLIPSLLLPLAVGALAAFLTKDAIAVFRSVAQPPLSSPTWLFPIVWTLLYLMMGLASYYVWTAPVSPARKDRALSLYLFSLGLNFLWPLVFFGLELFAAAFFLLLLLWGTVALCTLMFWYISDAAGKLMLPYLVWLSFAAYLNMGVWLLNR